MLCREHAAQLRDEYQELKAKGAEVVAVGTGSQRYAAAFADDEHIPFPVLVDDDAAAAHAAGVRRVGMLRLLTDRRSLAGTRRARAAGPRIHKSGRRVTQLGATVVIGPGDQLRYEHIDEHSADHAALEDVLAAVAA
ncbi:MAG TPA: AhpC/TSA family protein [Acidimicrobiia bacterium]|nr:AhpC/TSA family protein [Acidimicrobiia bacterium]